MNCFTQTVHGHDKILMILAETDIARQLTAQKHVLWSQLSKFTFSDFNSWFVLCEQCIHFIDGHIKILGLYFAFRTISISNYRHIFPARSLAANIVTLVKGFYQVYSFITYCSCNCSGGNFIRWGTTVHLESLRQLLNNSPLASWCTRQSWK